MCGIAGFFSYDCQVSGDLRQGEVVAMGRSLRHRGPDAAGVWSTKGGSVIFAHQRLAILDLSPTGAQPMTSPSGRFTITFNGEIYNYRELKDELTKLGSSFKGSSDTEVILVGFERWGVSKTLERMFGMFAFAVWDDEKKEITFARDRIGEKPLYLYCQTNQIYFASELRAFCAVKSFAPNLSQAGIASYLQFGYVPEDKAIYENVFKLRPGCFLTLRQGFGQMPGYLDAQPYWSVPAFTSDAASGDFSIAKLEQLLENVVSEQMVSDVPLGAFLSGGIDSSLVVALMQKQSSRPVKTFTIAFEEPGLNEAQFAAEIARHLKTDHHEFMVTGSLALEVLPRISNLYDEPFADPSGVPTYILSKHVRDHVTVALSGDGGDEVFAGYNRYVFLPKIWRALGWLPQSIRLILAGAIDVLPDSIWRNVAQNDGLIINKLHKAVEAMRSQDFIDAYWRTTSMSDRRRLEGILKRPITWSPHEVDFKSELFHRLQRLDLTTYLPGDVMVKVDRAAMSVSLETRAPFLDARIIDYMWTRNNGTLIEHGRGKIPLRTILEKYVPKTLFERQKHGFSVPVGAWLSGPLRNWAGDLLAKKSLRDKVDFDWIKVEKVWAQHLSGRREESTLLWTIFSLLAWLDSSDVQK